MEEVLMIEELEIEPISDEILAQVLGRSGEEDGFFAPSCSYTHCSTRPPVDED